MCGWPDGQFWEVGLEVVTPQVGWGTKGGESVVARMTAPWVDRRRA
jgi:hypothetical protein